MNSKTGQSPGAARWLMLVHQVPPKPAYVRVKLWRRLQQTGAVLLKQSVYLLPASEQSQELFRRLLRDIEQSGGHGVVCAMDLIAGMSSETGQALFRQARDADYDALMKDLRQHARRKAKKPGLDPALAKYRQRLADIVRIDFFGAKGRTAAEALVAELEHNPLRKGGSARGGQTLGPADMIGKIWVTRQDIHVDRIACTWLIKRFIDPKARFKFVPDRRYAGRSGELGFDMPDGEFTHEGDDCSFEVLLRRSEVSDHALNSIAQIIHNIDLKDHKFDRPETAGIAHVIAGICRTQPDDDARIAQGKILFDNIYEQFRRGSR